MLGLDGGGRPGDLAEDTGHQERSRPCLRAHWAVVRGAVLSRVHGCTCSCRGPHLGFLGFSGCSQRQEGSGEEQGCSSVIPHLPGATQIWGQSGWPDANGAAPKPHCDVKGWRREKG